MQKPRSAAKTRPRKRRREQHRHHAEPLLARQSTESLEYVATAMDRVQQEIDPLWRDSVSRANLGRSERLVEVSHALQRAVRLLDEDRAIG